MSTAQTPATSLENKRLTVSDLITIGVFSALYFTIVGVCALASMAIFGVVGNLLLPALAALLSGPVFMLMVARVHRFGAITIMGTILALFLFISGHFAISLITGIVFPLIGDAVARISAYRNRLTLICGYVIFSFGCTGPILPLWMMKDAYIANLGRKGKDSAYINTLFSAVNTTSLVIVLIATVVGAVLGALFGLRLMRRHFAKAGVLA
ncbi:MptD family putative ECF transporter S component [Bifidobacterium canis]|uniref:ABC transporter permease n=1 Tax=Bifidobacterium canis TaxID=2610880 RepID=A0A7K1J4C2_9BIFI|nr:ABC transporter permease [Bifidobacterium canis]